MLFTSPEFILFFSIILIFVALCNRDSLIGIRNSLLILASYYFYGKLNIYYPLLLVYVTATNYFAGRLLFQSLRKKLIVGTTVILSLLPLLFLKYAPAWTDSLWLPVGLSFFTFQALTYTIDIYRGKIERPFNIINVALFVAFFPTLLSGPIERARNLIPQLQQKFPLCWNNLVAGAQLFVWGLFKKVVIADRLADIVNSIYSAGDHNSGATLIYAAVLYSFQIYCDFSGYASMAIGVGRAMGLKLTENFQFPYFASSIKDFWRRWHISLTSWFTEYVYISLGGNRVAKWRWMANISIVFLLSGIWHGATWAFIIWGAIHGFLYLIEHVFRLKDRWGIYRIVVFIGVTLAWVFFRVPDSALAASMIAKMFTGPWLPLNFGGIMLGTTFLTLGLFVVFIGIELMLYLNKMPKNRLLAMIAYSLLLVTISMFAVTDGQFVYFKF